jgi:Kdo2-lipid IVA lauroyltransferase/acyltransferase
MNPKSFPFFHYLAPQHWGTWLLLSFMRFCIHLPFSTQLKAGKLLGLLILKLSKSREHITQVNLTKCFPNKTKQEVQQLSRQHFMAMGMSVIEIAMCWWASDEKLKKLTNYQNLENMQKALSQKKGVLVLNAHFTPMLLAGRLLHLHFPPVHVVYFKHKNQLFEAMMIYRFRKLGGNVIDHQDMRGILRKLKQNIPVFYAPDQDFGKKHSIFVPFFNVPTATAKAIHRLPKIQSTAIVPLTYSRTKTGYTMSFAPALENFPSTDMSADLSAVNKIFEQQILEAPEQYLWMHRRFKTRPEGEASFYQ